MFEITNGMLDNLLHEIEGFLIFKEFKIQKLNILLSQEQNGPRDKRDRWYSRDKTQIKCGNNNSCLVIVYQIGKELNLWAYSISFLKMYRTERWDKKVVWTK